ncbi:transcriptional activator DEMETER isoform X1 [Arachis duranensis]|uniref:Transcriptional activator DEMETER isoform X1 n=1 Tax=Arachis duranensis TaxID=130453 RepID=A0A6P4BF13_ARADU|nr:transcriptional activator DEMETER isoform X1 [Arachis duranensis]
MNFEEQLLGQDEKNFQIENAWVPLSPEKLNPIRSKMLSDYPVNQLRGNFQNFPVTERDYMKEMLLHCNRPNRNLNLTVQTGQIGQYSSFDGNSTNRSRVLNHIAGSYTQACNYESSGLNSNALELLLKNNATHIASANRNLNLSVNMAARNPLLPKFHHEATSDVTNSYAGVHRCNIHSASEIIHKDPNRLATPNVNSELNGSNSNSLLNSSDSNQWMGIFSEIPQGDTYPKYNMNNMPLREADATGTFTSSLHSIPEKMDQFNFLYQLCTVPDDTIAESTSQEKGNQEDMALSRENETQEYCDELVQQIVDTSFVVSAPHGDQNGSDNICEKGIDLGFDLNKTPEQRVPKRRKHRPKVIVESKPKRNPNPATGKRQVKEYGARKKNVAKAAATPQADLIKETFDSTVVATKSCRKALNFDIEESRNESQRKIVCQLDISKRNEKDFNSTSEYKATEMLSGANASSVLPINQQDKLTVEDQQPRITDDINLSLNQKLTNTFSSKRNLSIAMSATAEEQQIANFTVTEKGSAQRNSDMCKERHNGCMQQYIRAKEIDNLALQSEACVENSRKIGELTCQKNLQLVSKVPSNSTKGRGSKRKYCRRIENQHDSATNALSTSLCQEILPGNEKFEGASLAKAFLKAPKRKRSQNRLPSKGRGRSSSQTMSKDDTQKSRIEEKNGCQSESKKKSIFSIEGNRALNQQNIGTNTDDFFVISGESYQIGSTLIDNITNQLNNLSFGDSNISETEGQKALVPYMPDASIIPYQESQFVKKQKPRPKVDLDPETERTWKLLMGKQGSEHFEGTDKEKEKWWEEERNVFRGRADSFIARMHLVQGDRRFSKWKGSVVDSVIGVFLTQNVSDHLSSSAFMSLAARFPLMSNSCKGLNDVTGRHKSPEEPELCMVYPHQTIISFGGEILRQPTYQLGFQTPHFTREIWTDNEMSSINPYNQSSEEEFLSSQDSLDSTVIQGTGGTRSCSGSNSESEGPSSGSGPSKTQFLTSATNSLQAGSIPMFREFYNSVNGVSLFEERTKHGQVENVKQSSMLDRKNSPNFKSAFNHPSIFSYLQNELPPVSSNYYGEHYTDTQLLKTFQTYGDESSCLENVPMHSGFHDTNYRIFGIKEIGVGGDKPTRQQYENGTQESPALPTMSPHVSLNKNPVLTHDISQSKSHMSCMQPLANHHLVGPKILPAECRPCIEALNTSLILGRRQDDVTYDCCSIPKDVDGGKGQVCSDNSSAEPNPQRKVYLHGPNKESKLKVSKARKVKPEHSENWDELRKEVQANRTIERSKDIMDSLDYEAVRCAPVKEISDTIKERGMNNMLAERIKEFLNRLVSEHGSIDLEWLRYVPADKAKDYLLSIRGLGLKSVECVRLLTLHHLAFPVDTNVGRIAVRLGWVPLQPLPESLQLHLLELYPVLESIQKYLWPRLCKLDQKTLYELHYQMITFGKVFCTKSRPNCNACPMRAECRHFASAFASARLALPGPEEKRITSRHVPITSERNPSINMNPVILPLPEINLIKEVGPENGKCEPIIEEPATPEQEWETIESDIEDFFEEPDEIPTIKLSQREFANNVQNCIQEYNQGDMSKALVALDPLSATIPVPKLKNVNRLRTEHQVYELPDSHPLLEKMDKREPDDPSPYLLAIWTPGETANSIEPPERRCISQDSTNLCNDETCFSCNSIREANSQTVRGTILIPCRTATRGSFPLNGTYFQVNELFADHASSIQPIEIPRAWIWNLPRRTVYFGTSVSSIFKGLSTQEIQQCFWRGFVCVRGFDQQTRAPRPLRARLHFPASRLTKAKITKM